MTRRCLFLLLLAMPAMASAQPIDMSKGGPVEVTARGGFEMRESEQVVIATDDARAVRGDVTVLADQLVAHYRKKAANPNAPAQPVASTVPGAAPAPNAATDAETGGNEVYRLEAHGHVHIVTPTDEAVGDNAVYDIDQAVLVLTGHALKLTTPSQVMTARDTMEYWSQQHMAIGRGDAVVITTDGRRIAADVLVAYTAQDGDTPAAPAAATGTDPLADGRQLKRVDAFGNVEVRTAVDIVRGDSGLYIPATGQGRVVGHARITHGNNQVNGPAADFNMKTGIARINAVPGTRVQGLLVPNDAPNAPPPAAPK
jgi:lipopolysaccharide export system protein LptA